MRSPPAGMASGKGGSPPGKRVAPIEAPVHAAGRLVDGRLADARLGTVGSRSVGSRTAGCGAGPCAGG
jgi:hypothetical protein